MITTPITCQVTRYERDTFGHFESIGGDGWLLEPGLVAADIAVSEGPGPYFVVSPNGETSFLTVHESPDGTHVTFSTDHGDQPLFDLVLSTP